MIYKKTAKGHQVLKDRSVFLSPKQRVAFILFDGSTPVHQILSTLSAMNLDQTDIDHLIQNDLIELSGQYSYMEQMTSTSTSTSTSPTVKNI